MNSTFQKIKAWRSRRQLRSLQRWEQIRAEGRARFVVRTAATYGLTGIGLTSLVGNLFGTEGVTLQTVIVYLFSGIVIASDSWNTMEGKYKNALIDARIKVSPSGVLPPE